MRKKIAASIGTGYSPAQRGDTQFLIQATPAEGVSLSDLEAAILHELNEIQQTPPSEAEIKPIIAQLTAAEVFEKDSLYGKAQALGRLAVVDLDWRIVETSLEHYKKIKAGDIQKVAQKYLISERMTYLELLPESK